MTIPATVDALRSLQLERLRETLRVVYERVPHYRQAFDAAGVHPDDLVTLEGLARFPFTTKTTSAPPTRSGCSRCRARRSSASTPRRAGRASRLWSDTRGATSTPGRS